MSTRARHRTVKLIGITARSQGSHDALCAYYAAATVLCALRPELSAVFECADAPSDPLFGGVRLRRAETVDSLVASWFTQGLELRRVVTGMNRACARPGASARATAFGYRVLRRSPASFEALCAEIDRGLPPVLAWEGGEIGNHTVAVIGYDRHARSRSRWLRIVDPIHMQEVIEWGQLAQLSRGPIEAALCTRHDGARPDKLTTLRGADQKLIGTGVHERYDPRAKLYAPL